VRFLISLTDNKESHFEASGLPPSPLSLFAPTDTHTNTRLPPHKTRQITCGRVRFFRTSIRSHHHELYKKPSKSSHSLAHYVRPSLHSLTHSCTCPAHKKTTLRGKNIRQPCVFNVGSQRPHYATQRVKF